MSPRIAGIARAPLILAAGAALALSACATGPGPAKVTRFHLGQPIAPGEIAVEPRPGLDPQSLEFRSYAGAVTAELTRLGFRPAASVGHSELVAVVDVARMSRDGPPRDSPFRIGIGGASFGRSTGVGGGVSFPVGRARSSEVVGTQLAVQIKRRSDGTVIWEGRASAEARGDSPAADPQASVTRLAQALFTGFPGESGRTITVK